MAIIDKNGNIRGAAGGMIYRVQGSQTIMQARPQFVRHTQATVRRSLEFGLASNTAMALRTALSEIYDGYDGKMINRLNAVVRKAIASCGDKLPGYRDIHDGDVSWLNGFQFNENSATEKMLKVRPAVLNDDGLIRITVPEIGGRAGLVYPKSRALPGCLLRFCLVSFNFRKETYQYLCCEEKDLGQGGAPSFTIDLNYFAEPGDLLFLTLSMHYYIYAQNGKPKDINSDACSPAEILLAFQVPGSPGERSNGPAAPEDEDDILSIPGYTGNEMLRNYAELNPQKQTL